MRRLKFYLIGFVPGILFLLLILNKKGVGCSGYLPNSRVIAETLSKKFVYSNDFQIKMKELNIDEKYLRDSIIIDGEINFEQSKAQKDPCPEYLLQSKKYQIYFKKCKKEVEFIKINNNEK